MKKIGKAIIAVWKILVGAVFCQFLPTSILAIGWTCRAMQRRALRAWQRHSPLSAADQATLRADPLFLAHESWPNWFMQARGPRRAEAAIAPKGFWSRLRRGVRSAGASLGDNLRIGLLGILNTSVVMVLPVVLWQIGWYTGWDNSFNKGYEQYYTGIAISWIGVLLFLAAMLYLPMAQARHAITGDWRSFYHLRTVWAITRNSPVRTVLLATAYTLASLPIAVALGVVQFLEKAIPETANFTDSQWLVFLERYYFRLAIYGFMAFVFVRWIAAGWYARTIVELLHTGRLKKDSLAGAETHALAALHLDIQGEASRLHPAIAATLALSRPVWRTAVIGGAVFVWFTFVAQIYVREFIAYHPLQGFMNQPLVQLPWFRYVPRSLVHAARAAERQAAESPEMAQKSP